MERWDRKETERVYWENIYESKENSNKDTSVDASEMFREINEKILGYKQ